MCLMFSILAAKFGVVFVALCYFHEVGTAQNKCVKIITIQYYKVKYLKESNDKIRFMILSQFCQQACGLLDHLWLTLDSSWLQMLHDTMATDYHNPKSLTHRYMRYLVVTDICIIQDFSLCFDAFGTWSVYCT